MRRLMVIVLVLLIMVSFAGCMESVDFEQAQQTKELMREAQDQIGMPNIKYFFERKMMKEILEKCDDPELVTYLYTKNLNGKYVYEGRGIGFGVPYSVQYTNPQRGIGNGATLPQADPSGLFKPEGLSATWYMMIDEDTGGTYVEYWEPSIIVKQKKVPAIKCEEWSLPDNY